MDKAPDAFRTISEVADVLETPTHVLRFWESRFPQIKPVKRAGGRRYYRPADVALLSGIRQLLHAEGMTIRGVQKVLREQGVRHVASLGGADLSDLDLEAEDISEDMGPETGQILSLDGVVRRAPPDEAEGKSADSHTRSPVQALFPPPSPPRKPQAPVDPLVVPRDGAGGFIAFASPRLVKPKPFSTGADPMPPAQATLPFETEGPADAEVPEAPHIWLDDEAELPEDAEVTLLTFPSVEPVAWVEAAEPKEGVRDTGPAEDSGDLDDASPSQPADTDLETVESDTFGLDLTGPPPTDMTVDPSPANEPDAHDTPPALEIAGLAGRLRALSAKAAPQTSGALAELHSRLGLLHAQMAEAVRLRR